MTSDISKLYIDRDWTLVSALDETNLDVFLRTILLVNTYRIRSETNMKSLQHPF
jgi:hypothetical protein